jgi:hypothetical protein
MGERGDGARQPSALLGSGIGATGCYGPGRVPILQPGNAGRALRASGTDRASRTGRAKRTSSPRITGNVLFI